MSVLQLLADLLYPPTCAICGNKGEVHRTLCRDCYDIFIRESFEHCPVCGNTARNCECGSEFLKHSKVRIGSRTFVNITFYNRSGGNSHEYRMTEKMIYRLKENGDFAGFFAGELSAELKKLFENAGEDLSEWIITYAPRSDENIEKYGFDQSEEIARRMSKLLKIPYKRTVIRSSGSVQKTLSAEERRVNAEESIIADPKKIAKDGKYILLDDIVTTGSTMMTVSRNLYFHGAEAVFPVFIAKNLPKKGYDR